MRFSGERHPENRPEPGLAKKALSPGDRQQQYRELIQGVRRMVAQVVPAMATVAVVSKGDPELLKLEGRVSWHFPLQDDGQYAGHYPHDSDSAVRELEKVRARGVHFFLIPATALWWLDHYKGFAAHLQSHFRIAGQDERTCTIFELSPATNYDSLETGWPERTNSPPACAQVGGTPQSNDTPPLFDADWYQQQYPDVVRSGLTPFEHYRRHGVKQGRSPHALFDSRFYWKNYPETVFVYLDPLEHYLTEGWQKGYKPNPRFDPTFYLATHRDVAEAGIEPLTHFVRFGFKENRATCPADLLLGPASKRAREPAAVDVAVESANAPLSVLFVSHDAHPYGAQHLLLTLTSWLKENGLVNPRFLLAGGGNLVEEFARIGPLLRLDSESSTNDRARSLRLLRSFCGCGVSAVYLNSAASGHIAELTRHLGVPQIAHIHELETSIQRWVGVAKMASLRAHVQMFIAASQSVAENLCTRHSIERERLTIIEEFIKSTRIKVTDNTGKRKLREALDLLPSAQVVLGCGTTDWRKGPDLFVQVAAQVAAGTDLPITFVWVGGETSPGERHNLDQLVEKHGLAERVKFIGAVSTPLPYMLASDLFLLPSREDPFPLVCLEAADCGLPIVCFADAGGMPDFVGSQCGAVVPYLDAPAMARAVETFLHDKAAMHEHGERARCRVRNIFEVAAKGQEVYTLLKQLCGNWPASGLVEPTGWKG